MLALHETAAFLTTVSGTDFSVKEGQVVLALRSKDFFYQLQFKLAFS